MHELYSQEYVILAELSSQHISLEINTIVSWSHIKWKLYKIAKVNARVYTYQLGNFHPSY